MLRMDLRRAKPGMTLALPVRHPKSPRQFLLKGNFPLTETAIRRLVDMNVRFVWVQYPSLSFLDGYVSQELMESQSTLVHQIEECFEKVQQQSAAKISYDVYTVTVGQMIAKLVENPQAAMFMGDLMDAADEELLRHSSTVGYLSLLMGLKLEGYLVKQRKHIPPGQAKEVTALGVGAMLHDIGLLELDPDCRERYLAAGDQSDPAYREHPSLGYRALRGKVQPTAATIVLHHHQRYDGTGFAGHDWPVLEGERIHVFARIVGVADAFDRIRYPLGAPRRSTVEALQMMTRAGICEQFDPRVLRALFTVVPPFAPGTILRLTDGRWAVAIDHNLKDPCRPQVQIIADPSIVTDGTPPVQDPIDLAETDPDLRVAECESQDVLEHLFESPPFLLDEMLALNWC